MKQNNSHNQNQAPAFEPVPTTALATTQVNNFAAALAAIVQTEIASEFEPP